MTVAIVKLGSPRAPREGPRIGSVRRPPRGVPKSEFAKRDFYDVWMPLLSPPPELVAFAMKAQTPAQWETFRKRFRSQMARDDASRVLQMLALLSKSTDFAVGCYCEEESKCHRSVLREIFVELGASVK